MSVLLDVHAKEGSERMLRKIMGVLLGEGLDGKDALQLDLLKTLGRAYASSGHISLVESELIPALREQMDKQVVDAYRSELEQAVARSAIGGGKGGVFEESLADYPNPLKVKGKEKTMDVIERTLPALLPVSTTCPADALFESSVDTTDYPLPSSSSLIDPPTSSVLEELVAKGEMGRATRLLQEMLDIGVAVPTKGPYGLAALSALKRVDANLDLEPGAKEEFLMWFDLFPPRWELDSAEYMATLAKIETQLLWSPILDLPLIVAFSELSAKKGYGRRVIRAGVFRVLVKTATAEKAIWESFLEAFVGSVMANANAPAAKKDLSDGMEDTNDPRRLVSMAYGEVIRCLVTSNRIEDALRLIRNDPKCPAVLPPHSYRSILKHIQISSCYSSSRSSNSNYVEIFTALAEANLSRAVELNIFREQHLLQSPPLLESSLEEAMLKGDAEGVYKAMEAKASSGERVGKLTTIVEFLGRELGGEFGGENGVQKRVTDLWANALQSAAGGAFVLVEMMLYHKLGLWQLVLDSFVAHFWIMDLPKALVLKRLRQVREERRNGKEGMRRVCVPYVADETDVEMLWRYQKLAPTRAHTNLVWTALAHLEDRDGWVELEALYKDLVDSTTVARERYPNAGFTNEGAFTVFLRSLARIPVFSTSSDPSLAFSPSASNEANARMLPQRALEVLDDMRALGVPINIYHYTEVGGILARAGDVDGALKVVQAVLRENNKKRETVDDVFFTSVMRCFLAAGNVIGARKVFDCMQSKSGFAYVQGKDAMLDDVLQEILRRGGYNRK